MAARWPERWQQEAIDAVEPFLGTEVRLDIILGPTSAVSGTRMGGFVYLDGDVPTIIHDRSGRPDVYPWALLAGPVLRVSAPRPRRRALILFAQPGWAPPAGEKSAPRSP